MFKLMQVGNFISSIAMKVSQFFVDSVNLATGSLENEDLLSEGGITTVAEFAVGVQKIVRQVVAPVMIAVGAALAIYMVYLGVMYAKAEDATKRKDVMGKLIAVGIAIVIVIVGITLCYAINWVELLGPKHEFEKISDTRASYCKYCGLKEESSIHKA